MNRKLILMALAALLASCGQDSKTEPESAAPAFVSSTPADGASGIALDDFVLKVKYSANVRFSGTAAISPSTATISFKEAHDGVCQFEVGGLQYETKYTVTIPAGAVYVYGEPKNKAAEVKISFTTEDAPPTPPESGKGSGGWENSTSAVLGMKTGWNLGNTLDSNGDWISGGTSAWETAWGQPVTKPELIRMFADAGFGAIRVPVTWKEHIGADFTVDEAWMKRVQEVVGYVLDAGLYCILNVHHDTGTEGWLHASSSNYAAQSAKFKALWKQIAERFKDCGEKLLFESFNEMLDNSNNWGNPSADAVAAINSYNADFVQTVRATGGGNAHRNLIVNTYAANVESNSISGFALPADSATDHLIAEFHSYAPYRFAFKQDDASQQLTVFDSACETEVKNLLTKAINALHAKGVPCIIGEYGADSSAASESEIAKQATCYVSTAKSLGAACFYWMALSDGKDRSEPKWTKPLIKDAIINAYGK